MPEAMKRVKAELGPNAVILHSRETGRGLIGLFSPRGVEVTAAVDDAPKPSQAAPPAPEAPKGGGFDIRIGDEPNPLLSKPAQQPKPTGSEANRAESAPPAKLQPNKSAEDNPLLALARQIASEHAGGKPGESKASGGDSVDEGRPVSKGSSETEAPGSSQGDSGIEKRLGSLEEQLHKLTGMLEKFTPGSSGGADASPVPARTRELYNHLLQQDVDEGLALNLATSIAESSDEDDDVWTLLKARLTERIPVAGPLPLDFDAKRPKVIMLVGPTGVGKTTTLAKISALYRYDAKAKARPKIAFITADLYRLAAVEQLQKYTEILGVDLEVTYSDDEVKQAIDKHKNAQLILFDTAGTCQRNLPQLDALASIKEAAQPDEVHLVLSATSKFSDVIDVIEHFKSIGPRRLLFTKIDESTTYGGLLNTVSKYEIPISYITTGQNVPEDIEAARPERISKLLLTKPTINRSIEIKQQAEKPASDEMLGPPAPEAAGGEAEKPKPDSAPVMHPNRRTAAARQENANEKSNSRSS